MVLFMRIICIKLLWIPLQMTDESNLIVNWIEVIHIYSVLETDHHYSKQKFDPWVCFKKDVSVLQKCSRKNPTLKPLIFRKIWLTTKCVRLLGFCKGNSSMFNYNFTYKI